jgi:hypothetical protein
VINRLQAKINHRENFHRWQEKVASPVNLCALLTGGLLLLRRAAALLNLEKWVGNENINPEIIFS